MPGVPLPDVRTLQSLADQFGGTVKGSARQRQVLCIAAAELSDSDALVPVFTQRALKQLGPCRAATLVGPQWKDKLSSHDCWVHPHPQWALACLLESIAPAPPIATIDTRAIVQPGTKIAHHVHVGPGAVVLKGASIGSGSIIEPNAVIYGGVQIGQRVLVGAGAVIGRPGFGWCTAPDKSLKRIPQLGGVVVEDDVEIGALATVDAGTLKPTRLACGCKLDAQVHIGHNVEIGSFTMVAAQSGFAGSASVGEHVLVGGQVGVADHVAIGDHAHLAGRSGVIGPIASHATVAGYPAVDRMRWLRAVAKMMREKS